MTQRNITVTIVPDKRKIKDDVTFPLKLRITYQGKRKYYATGCHASLNDYSLINRKHIHNDFMCTLTITPFGFFTNILTVICLHLKITPQRCPGNFKYN